MDELAEQFQWNMRVTTKHCLLCKIRKADIQSIIDPTLCNKCRVYVCHFNAYDT